MNFNGIEWNLELKDLEPESISYGISVKAADQIGLKSRDRVLQVGIRACLILGFV